MVHGSSPGLGNMISDIMILPSHEMSGIYNNVEATYNVHCKSSFIPLLRVMQDFGVHIHANFQTCNTYWKICDVHDFLDIPRTLLSFFFVLNKFHDVLTQVIDSNLIEKTTKLTEGRLLHPDGPFLSSVGPQSIFNLSWTIYSVDNALKLIISMVPL